MAQTDKQIARAQWLAQVKVIRRNRERLARVFPKVYDATVSRWELTGSVTVPIEMQRALATVLTAMWREAVRTGARFPLDDDKSAFPHLERKEEEQSLFDQIVQDFINRYGAMKVQQILETTRDQIVRVIDRGVRDGKGVEEIGRAIRESIPSFSRLRANTIARTETHTASIYAGQEVAKTSPFPMNKRWVSVFDHRTRDFGEGDGIVDQANHRAMNNVTVGPDELFAVPSFGRLPDLMAFPGDPSAPAHQVINCRCALTYRRVGRPWPVDDGAG